MGKVLAYGTVTTWLVISLALNVVLAIALFLKTALNQIVVDVVKDFREKRTRREELLRELHERLATFDADYFMLLLSIGAEKVAAPGQPTKQLGGPGAAGVDAANKFFDKNLLEFPASVRLLLQRLRTEMLFKDVDLMKDGPTILDRSSAVTQATKKVRAEVERLLS